jgi:RNA polymerase sigma factor (sigma-70 family)
MPMEPPGADTHDFELVRRMAEAARDFALAREAWGHLYIRHHHFLMRLSMANHGYLLGREGVKDLVQEAFMKAFDRAATFNHTEVCDGPSQQKKLRAWLVRIVANLVNDRYRGEPEADFTDELDETSLVAQPPEVQETDSPDSLRLGLLKSGLRSLSDIEQTVLRGTMFWWRPDQQHQRMPHAALSQLCEQTGKSAANIRQIRSRAIKKLQEYVSDRSRP